MKNNKHKATLILVIFSLGFFISYPFRDNFWIGLISNACAASMIGGLADWFAVTAIFRKPLGINWPSFLFRTNIIPRSRESIVNDLVDIVENDLLSKENIKGRILNINLLEMLENYIEEAATREDIKLLLKKLINEFYKNLTNEDVKGIVQGGLNLGAQKLDLSEFLSSFIVFLYENNYDDEIIDFSIDMFSSFIKHNKTHVFFTQFVENVIAEYENGSSSRAMTIKMLLNFVLKKTPSDLAKSLENVIADAAFEVKDRENSIRYRIKEQIQGFAKGLVNNPEMRLRIEEWKFTGLNKISELINGQILNTDEFKIKYEDLFMSPLGEKLESILDNIALSSILSNGNKEEAELYIKELVISFINNKHGEIGAIVRHRINQFSTEELVELMESTAGNDLQMIRINGSVVGGMVGIMTYLFTYFIGKLF